MCFITMIAKTNTYQRNAVHNNTELNGNRNFVNVTLMLMAEVFDWRENKSKELTEAEPWMSLREQWAGQPLSSNVTTRPAAGAQGGAAQLRRGRWAWRGALTVWLRAWGHSEGEGKDVLMALDRLQKPQDVRAVPAPVHQLDGGTSISWCYSISLTLPASGNLSPASLPEQLCRLWLS